LLAPHRPISFEMDLGAGLLPDNRVLPVGEGFFGGNMVRRFIPGDTWEIRSDPYLRSLPQLTVRPSGSSFGATRYFAWNSTVAPTVWGRPLLPRELLDDAMFQKVLKGQLTSAETLLSNDYIVKNPLLGTMQITVRDLGKSMALLRAKLEELKALPEPGQSTLMDALSALDDVDGSIETAMEDPREQQSPTLAYRTLAKGFGANTPAALNTLAEILRKLRDVAPATHSSLLESEAKQLVDAGKGLSQRLDEVESQAVASAHKDMAFARRLVDRLLHEVNVVSAAPLLMFDVVRVGPDPTHRWQFGAGPGLRLSLVNVNLTLGYSFNIQRRPGEPRGAFLIQFSVSDLFR
jgi:hypothetical protein